MIKTDNTPVKSKRVLICKEEAALLLCGYTKFAPKSVNSSLLLLLYLYILINTAAAVFLNLLIKLNIYIPAKKKNFHQYPHSGKLQKAQTIAPAHSLFGSPSMGRSVPQERNAKIPDRRGFSPQPGEVFDFPDPL